MFQSVLEILLCIGLYSQHSVRGWLSTDVSSEGHSETVRGKGRGRERGLVPPNAKSWVCAAVAANNLPVRNVQSFIKNRSKTCSVLE